MAETKPGGPQKIATIVLLCLSIAGLTYGVYAMTHDGEGFPFFIGAAMCGAFAAIIGSTAKKKAD